MFFSFWELPNSVFHPVWQACGLNLELLHGAVLMPGMVEVQNAWDHFQKFTSWSPRQNLRKTKEKELAFIACSEGARHSAWHLHYSHNSLLKQALFPFRLWGHCDTWDLNRSSKFTRWVCGRARFWIQMYLNDLSAAQPSMLKDDRINYPYRHTHSVSPVPSLLGGKSSGQSAPVWAQVGSHELRLWTVAGVHGGWDESFGLCHKNAFLLCLLYT